MGFKLPEKNPSNRSTFEEWTDYAEYLAICKGFVSINSLFNSSKLILDEEKIDGIESDDDEFNHKAVEVVKEINRRINILGKKYPFKIEYGYSLKFHDKESSNSFVYRFLLFATINNMTSKKSKIKGIDPTKLFEYLCTHVVRGYFGKDIIVEVFGTGKVSGFKSKLDKLIHELGEGEESQEHPYSKPKDDGLDIYAFKSFKDKRESKFIAFGQCKTGTYWIDGISKLDPRIFCNKWFRSQPFNLPIKMFFVAQYFPYWRWSHTGREAGLIFDRIRIMEFMPEDLDQADSDLFKKIQYWSLKILHIED